MAARRLVLAACGVLGALAGSAHAEASEARVVSAQGARPRPILAALAGIVPLDFSRALLPPGRLQGELDPPSLPALGPSLTPTIGFRRGGELSLSLPPSALSVLTPAQRVSPLPGQGQAPPLALEALQLGEKEKSLADLLKEVSRLPDADEESASALGAQIWRVASGSPETAGPRSDASGGFGRSFARGDSMEGSGVLSAVRPGADSLSADYSSAWKALPSALAPARASARESGAGGAALRLSPGVPLLVMSVLQSSLLLSEVSAGFGEQSGPAAFAARLVPAYFQDELPAAQPKPSAPPPQGSPARSDASEASALRRFVLPAAAQEAQSEWQSFHEAQSLSAAQAARPAAAESSMKGAVFTPIEEPSDATALGVWLFLLGAVAYLGRRIQA